MALSRGMVLFFLLLLVAAEIGMIDAKTGSKQGSTTVNSLITNDKEVKKEENESHDYCLSQSHKYKGFCLNSDNCATVCKQENFVGGKCKLENAMRKCFCKKPC